MKERMIQLYSDLAKRISLMSRATRLKVGAVLVKDDNIISFSWNGTPAGWDNECEYKEYDLARDFEGNHFPWSETHYPHTDDYGRYKTVTKPEVIHAEANLISKLARSNASGQGAYIFITHAPCMECSKLIYGAGITKVYFNNAYRNEDGINFLKKCNIETIQLKEQNNAEI